MPHQYQNPQTVRAKDDVFHKVCDTKTPQGILTVLKQFHYSEKDIYGGENPLLLLLEGIPSAQKMEGLPETSSFLPLRIHPARAGPALLH